MPPDNDLPIYAWQDFSEEDVPEMSDICAACNEGYAVPFDVKDAGNTGELYVDQRMGLDHSTTTLQWVLDRKYATADIAKYLPPNASERDYRDTFAERMFTALAQMCSEEKLAEIYAYIGVEEYMFECVDELFQTSTEPLSPFYGMTFKLQPVEVSSDRSVIKQEFKNNFIFVNPSMPFAGNKIYYTSFSQGKLSRGGFHHDRRWEASGQYDAQKAAHQFLANYEQQKANDAWWRNFWASVEVGMAVLSVVPIVGQFAAAARGTILAVRAVKYAFYTVEAALTADSFIHGTTQLLGGKSISLGTELFKAIGQLVDPVNGAKRGEQAFLVLNLALLTPLAVGGAKRVYSYVGNRRAAAEFSDAVINEAQHAQIPSSTPSAPVNPDRIPTQGQPLAIHLDISTKVDLPSGPYVVTTRMTPSLDTKSTFFTMVSECESVKANICLQAKTLKEQLVLLISQGTRASRIAKPLERAANAHLSRHLVETLGVDPKNVLGALENASGHGLDLIIRVPPPPSMVRRVPQSGAERNSIIGAVKSHANAQETIDFTKGGRLREGEMIVVFEVKSTRTARTPGFIGNTQGLGGEGNVNRFLNLINRGRGVNSRESMLRATPNYKELADALKKAQRTGNIEYMHAQVFFKPDGAINTAVGGGSGIQLNNWVQ